MDVGYKASDPGSSSSSFIHSLIQLQYNNNKEKKEVKTKLTIHRIKHNKGKECVAAKGAKLSSWLLPHSGYKRVEVIQYTCLTLHPPSWLSRIKAFKASQWSFSLSLLYYTVKLDLSYSSCNFTERNNLTSADVT